MQSGPSINSSSAPASVPDSKVTPLLDKDEKLKKMEEGVKNQSPVHAPPGGPEDFNPVEARIQQYPRAATIVQKANDNFLENLALPVMFGIAGYLYSELEKCQRESKDPKKYDPVYTTLIAMQFMYVTVHLARAGITAFKADYNQQEAMRELLASDARNGIKIESSSIDAKMHEIYSSRYVHVSRALDFTTFVGINAAAVLFTKEQFESGIGAAWFSLASYLVSSFLKGKQGEKAHRVITEEEYKQVMSNAQKKALGIGGLMAAGGGIALALVDHFVRKQLETGGTNSHTLASFSTQAVMIAGFGVAGTYFALRGADAMNDAVESKVQKPEGEESKLVAMNTATLFGRKVRRDAKNLGLASTLTVFSAGVCSAFSLSPETVIKLLPFSLAAVGLTWVAQGEANVYAQDVREVTKRMRDPSVRLSSGNPARAHIEEISDDKKDDDKKDKDDSCLARYNPFKRCGSGS